MIVRSIEVEQYRSIRHAVLECESLTALVGPNGCGKSSFLRALELFFAKTPNIVADDFHGAISTESPITITVTFSALSTVAHDAYREFSEHGEFTVKRQIRLEAGRVDSKFLCKKLIDTGLAEFRAITSAAEAKLRYEELRGDGLHRDLPVWTNHASCRQHSRDWESENPDRCTRQWVESAFVNSGSGGVGDLTKYVRLLFIPAVRDAGEDSQDGRGSPISELMEIAVRQSLATREEFVELRKQFNQAYKSLIVPENVPEALSLQV